MDLKPRNVRCGPPFERVEHMEVRAWKEHGRAWPLSADMDSSPEATPQRSGSPSLPLTSLPSRLTMLFESSSIPKSRLALCCVCSSRLGRILPAPQEGDGARTGNLQASPRLVAMGYSILGRRSRKAILIGTPGTPAQTNFRGFSVFCYSYPQSVLRYHSRNTGSHLRSSRPRDVCAISEVRDLKRRRAA